MRTGEAPVRGESMLPEITSWLGGSQLAVLPVVRGSWQVSDQADVRVSGSVQFSVPNVPQWRAVRPGHPLAAFGQRLRVRVSTGDQSFEQGWFRLMSAKPSGAVIQVQGVGLLRNVERARFLKPFGVGGVTRRWIVQRLLQGILPYQVHWSLSDTVMAKSLWERERIEALWDVVETWPARMYVDDSGVVVIAPPWDDSAPGAAVWSLLDGEGGNLSRLESVTSGEDDDAPNAFVVSSVPDGAETAMTEVWVQPHGPMRWDAEGLRYGMNPQFYSSPLLPQNRTTLQTVARNMGARAARTQARVSFDAAPDPRPQVGDVVRVRSARQGVDGVGRVVSLTLSSTALAGEVALL